MHKRVIEPEQLSETTLAKSLCQWPHRGHPYLIKKPLGYVRERKS